MPGVSGGAVVTMLVCFLILHTRLRARRAPGIPCALCSQRAGGSGKTRAENVRRDRGAVAGNDVAVWKLNLAVIAREGGRSSIPETSVMESRSCGVLDTPHARGMTGRVHALVLSQGRRREIVPPRSDFSRRHAGMELPGILQ